AQGVHDAVQVRADPQAVQAEVVAGVDDRGDPRANPAGVLAGATQESRPPDPAGQHHHLHGAILAHHPGGVAAGWRLGWPDMTSSSPKTVREAVAPVRDLAAFVLL